MYGEVVRCCCMVKWYGEWGVLIRVLMYSEVVYIGNGGVW